MGSPQILICGESGGTSCFYDLAERYRHRNLVAERDAPLCEHKRRYMSQKVANFLQISENTPQNLRMCEKSCIFAAAKYNGVPDGIYSDGGSVAYGECSYERRGRKSY